MTSFHLDHAPFYEGKKQVNLVPVEDSPYLGCRVDVQTKSGLWRGHVIAYVKNYGRTDLVIYTNTGDQAVVREENVHFPSRKVSVDTEAMNEILVWHQKIRRVLSGKQQGKKKINLRKVN